MQTIINELKANGIDCHVFVNSDGSGCIAAPGEDTPVIPGLNWGKDMPARDQKGFLEGFNLIGSYKDLVALSESDINDYMDAGQSEVDDEADGLI